MSVNELKNQKERKRVSMKNESLKKLREIVSKDHQEETVARWTEYKTLSKTIEKINNLEAKCAKLGLELPRLSPAQETKTRL